MIIDLDNSNPHLVYSKEKLCYECKISRRILNFEIEVLEEGSYTFSMKYNSSDIPGLYFFINGILADNNFCKQKTNGKVENVSIRYENGPFKLVKGKHKLSIRTKKFFPLIYSFEFNKYEPIEIIPYQYKPSDFVVFKLFNIYGGFFWQINNVMVCTDIALKKNKIPIIHFDNGFFINNTDLEIPIICGMNSWFQYFYKDPVDIEPCYYNFAINWHKKVEFNKLNIMRERPDHIYLYTKQTFKTTAFHKFLTRENVRKYLKFQPYIVKYIDSIKAKIFDKYEESNKNGESKENKQVKYLGIHFRGTDKVSETGSPEGHPKRFKYETVLEMILKEMEELRKDGEFNVEVIVSTDENPFIDFLKENLDCNLYCSNTLKSNYNSSGLVQDFMELPKRNENTDLEKFKKENEEKYEKLVLRDKLVNNSVHMGHKNYSNYRKGLDCLVDCLILDRSNTLLVSEGNFSIFTSLYLKDENAKIIKMD